MLNLILGVIVGGALGAWMGKSRSCETGTCPLTSNPWIGGAYGGLMGLVIMANFTPALFGQRAAAEKESTNMSTTAISMVTEIQSKEDFQAQVLSASKPVLVDLWATWCAPCRAQSPILEQVAQSAGDRAQVVKINVDEAESLAAELRVSSIPTLLVFKNGQEVQRMVGVQSAQTLLRGLGL